MVAWLVHHPYQDRGKSCWYSSERSHRGFSCQHRRSSSISHFDMVEYQPPRRGFDTGSLVVSWLGSWRHPCRWTGRCPPSYARHGICADDALLARTPQVLRLSVLCRILYYGSSFDMLKIRLRLCSLFEEIVRVVGARARPRCGVRVDGPRH